MIVRSTPLAGVMEIVPEPHRDERGSFARMWCVDEFAEHGIDGRFVQSSLSWNAARGTTRGLHFAAPPSREAKLVQVVAGALFDAVVDLRPASPTYGRAWWTELSAREGRALYIPPQCAHGFQTLVDDTRVVYCMTEAYAPALARSVHWRSPQFAIPWPLGDAAILSPADRAAGPYDAARALGNDGAGDRPG